MRYFQLPKLFPSKKTILYLSSSIFSGPITYYYNSLLLCLLRKQIYILIYLFRMNSVMCSELIYYIQFPNFKALSMPKPKKDKEQATNYYPLTMIPVMCNWRTEYWRTNEQLIGDQRNIAPEHSFGFRKRKSTNWTSDIIGCIQRGTPQLSWMLLTQ